MYPRDFAPPSQQSYFLFGPRGTGKSMFVGNHYPNGMYVDLLDARNFNEFTADPSRLSDRIPKGFNDWIIVDEVQKVPALLNEVHRLIEQRHLRFVLTGSSARRLKKDNVNLLAGRALTCHLYPLTASEQGNEFNLTRALDSGQLPLACTSADPELFLQSYVQTYLQEEIQLEGLTRNLPAFARFLETASFSQGSLLNISAIARDCAVKRKVVENYFSILRDTLISYEIPVFRKRAKRDTTQSAKFYFFDAGVFRTLRPAGPYDSDTEARGIALETLVLQEIIALNSYRRWNYGIYYWRTRLGKEVDFVLYGKRGLKAIEIKLSGRIRTEDLSGLRQFKEDYPETDLIYLYSGTRRFTENDIEIVPVDMFFKQADNLI
ncbi:MAG: ATP-binding protein [Gammaproteobacteria bacterium]|nr:ATP-binding protein [Gammaproteobacteria bacterium]MCY4228500.1 ATP-binding protein [Gammaproteobacteria bacterium]